jgi:predicted PurR-regulated permease PerM
MVDPVQLVLLLVIVILTGLLVILGIQVFYIFKELRTTLKKTNRVLDNADSITANIEGPLSALSSLALGAKATSLITVAKFVKNVLSKDKDSDDKKRDRE